MEWRKGKQSSTGKTGGLVVSRLEYLALPHQQEGSSARQASSLQKNIVGGGNQGLGSWEPDDVDATTEKMYERHRKGQKRS